jgi:CO/xanthine dehydrogenase FAD-binding subunit
MDIAVVGVGVLLGLDELRRTIEHARIVLGAVAPTPIRARQAEAALGTCRFAERIERPPESLRARLADLRRSCPLRSVAP